MIYNKLLSLSLGLLFIFSCVTQVSYTREIQLKQNTNEELNTEVNKLVDDQSMEKDTELSIISTQGTITDLSPLSNLSKFTQLIKLNISISGNKLISNISTFEGILDNAKGLLNLNLNFSLNRINDLSVLSTILNKNTLLNQISINFQSNSYDGCNNQQCNYDNSKFIIFEQKNCQIKDCNNVCKKCFEQANKCTQCTTSTLEIKEQEIGCITIENCQNLQGYYIDQTVTPKQCSKCQVQNCSTCQKGEECEECFSHFYLKEKICEKCTLNCFKCENSDTCVLCDGEYYKDGQNQCQKCLAGCEVCEDNKVCKKCLQNLYLSVSKDKCLIECEEGQYLDGENQCHDCPEGTYPKNKQLTYENIISENQYCADCGTFCKVCHQRQVCLECINKEWYSISDGNCYKECPIEDGYYIVQSEQQSKCEKCIQNCDQCEDGNSCKFCSKTFYLRSDFQCYKSCEQGQYQNLETRTCNSCPEGTYLNPDYSEELKNYCIPCADNCQKCTGPKQCDQCANLYKVKADDGTCHITCPVGKGYYKEGQNCKVCIFGCAECQDKVSCKDCASGYFKKMNDVTCVEKCEGDGQYGDLLTNECKVCEEGKYLEDPPEIPLQYCYDCGHQCKVCKIKSYCQKCHDEKDFKGSDGGCYKDCPKNNGYFELVDGEDIFCEKCQTNCQVCNSKEKCDKCNSETFLLKDECKSECSDGEYGDKETRICRNCSYDCLKCTSSENCQQCDKGVLFVGKCQDKCPDIGYYTENKICKECIQNCEKCTQKQQCDQCNSNYQYLIFDKNDVRVKCDQNCSQNNGYFIEEQERQYESHQNYVAWSYQYRDSKQLFCKTCLENCQKCSDKLNCTQCYKGYYYHSINRVDRVLQNNNACLKCSENCYECSKDVSTCISCQKDKYLEESKCVEKCSKGYELFTKTKECKPVKPVQWWIYLVIALSVAIIIAIVLLIILRYRRKQQRIGYREMEYGDEEGKVDLISLQDATGESQ